MRKIYYKDKLLSRVLGKRKKNIEKLEKQLKCKIDIDKEGNILIKGGKAMKEYLIEEILQSLALGFNINTALSLENQNYVLKIIDLKNYARGSRLKTIIGRIIGKKGKAKRVMQELSNCRIVISDSKVGIIGPCDNVEIVSQAIEKLIRGAPHSRVFKFLEQSHYYLEEQKQLEEELTG